MKRIITTYEPVAQRTVDCAHPDIPGEQVVLTVHQRIATFAFGEYVSSDLSGTAAGSYSGRPLAASTWTPELQQAYAQLCRTAPRRPKGFKMSGLGYGLVVVMVLALGALVWGLAQPWLASQASATAEDAQARVARAFEAPAPGVLLLVGTSDGKAFRWYQVESVRDDIVELVGSEGRFDLSYALPEAGEMTFDGPTLSIPRDQFAQDGGVLIVDGSVRLVANASP